MPLNRCVITMLSDGNGLFFSEGACRHGGERCAGAGMNAQQSLLASLERKADPRGGAKE